MQQRRRAARSPVDGVLVLDKPAGLSSNAAMLWARRLFDARKAGHGGTLDPLATGVLPVLMGEATKFAADLLDADKSYEATLALGVTTTTGDAEGEPLVRRRVAVDAAALQAACAAFVGRIEQVPPMHSALKRDGRPLYAYAREGVVLERAPRTVHIHAIEVLRADLDAPDPVATLHVRCSKGTYVRTLAEDIGERLGCGAHLAALRRTAAGVLSIDQAVSLQALEAFDAAARTARLLPIDALLQSLEPVELDAARAARFIQGQGVPLAASQGATGAVAASPAATSTSAATSTAARMRVYAGGRLLGLGERDDRGRLMPVRLIAQDPMIAPGRSRPPPAGPGEPATAAVLASKDG